MSIKVIDTIYSTRNYPLGNNFPLWSQFQKVTDIVEVTCNFNFQSSLNEQVLIVSNYELRLLGGNWSEKGYVLGDNILIYGTINNAGVTVTFSGLSRTIQSISGDTLAVNSTLDVLNTNVITGQSMPLQAGSSSNTSIGIKNNSRVEPQTIQLFHNLIENSSNNGVSSLFDGEPNQFEFEGVSGLSVGGTLTGVQQGNKSGGSYVGYELERLSDVANPDWTFTSLSQVRYKLTLTYFQYLKFEDSDFDKPSYLLGNGSLKPFYRFKARSQQNNPNALLTNDYSGQLGNIGWRDENYSQGVNDFILESFTITDTSSNLLSEVDFSQSCIISAIITHPTLNFLDTTEVEFYLIPDVEEIKNKPERNCDLIQLSNFFIDNSTSTITSDVFGVSGAEMQTSIQAIDVSTPNKAKITFQTNPNPEFTARISSFNSLSRRYVITATVQSAGGSSNVNNAVSLTLKEGILELAPIVGAPYPVREQTFFNHANEITGVGEPNYKGCTEDDFVYKALFNLTEGVTWSGINLNVQVVNDSDGSSFDLVSKFVNFSNFVVFNNKIQINYNETINQYLDSPDRNQLKISLTGNDLAPNYEVQIIWSLISSWRYWIAQNNAFIDFYNSNVPNDGRNQEWMRYLRLSGYSLRVRVNLIDDNNTAHYFGAGVELQDYDDSSNIITDIEYYDSSGGSQNGFIANDIMTIKAVHTLISGSWSTSDVWGWISLRPFENEINKRISTEWEWTSQNYPLMPPSNEVKAKLTFPSASEAVVECRVNTSMINVETSTTIARIESPKNPTCTSPIDYLFDIVAKSSDNEMEYVEILEQLLEQGIIANNMCCPTCQVNNTNTGLIDEVYMFGSNSLVNSMATLYDINSYCCIDVYQGSQNCNANFNTDWDNFMLNLSGGGDIPSLNALIPTQVNKYNFSSFNLIKTKIQSITSNISIQYGLTYVVVNMGLLVVCNQDGKFISKIDTPKKITTDGIPKLTTNNNYKITS